jgi:uroporphyrinogen-III synthase
MAFAGLRVFSFESRRAREMAELIRRQGGEAFVTPAMREAPLGTEDAVFAFAERLFAGEFEMVILLTGAGVRLLDRVLARRYPPERFADALRRLTVVARGPKPVKALRELGVPVAITAPEPNTWREVLRATEGRPEKRIAVQEYGRPNPDLVAALEARGAKVATVRVYGWDLPEDTGPLLEAARRIAAGDADVVLFTTAAQAFHLFRVAEDAGIGAETLASGFERTVVASIGPTTTEALEEFGVHPDIKPSHPRMGFLVQETAEQAHAILAAKSVRR